jgi:hypothetical protein
MMEMTDNHQNRSIRGIHSFLNANNNQQYNLLSFCRREVTAECGSGPFKSTIADILDAAVLPRMISEVCQKVPQHPMKIFPA